MEEICKITGNIIIGKMYELKAIYNRIDKQKQLELQNIFNGIDFDFQELYNIASKKTKDMINVKIDEWRDKGLLKKYFGMLANNIYKRARVKNSEILELLIYGAYIEEQSKLEESELNIFKDVANYYYQQGQTEINNTLSKKEKKKASVIPDAIFLALLTQPNAKGYVWNQYIEAIIKFNAEQLYRQLTIDLQQGNKLDITNDIYQNIIKKQQNTKLNINDNSISGDVDLTLIGINNKAKENGIYSFDDKAKVKFVSVNDEKRTKMCESLDSQEFYINDWNEFERYSKSNDTIKKYKCYGLIIGLNCPPINDGFHWCRSYIIYLPPVENKGKSEYNLDIPRISKDIKPLLKDIKLNSKVKKLFNKYLTDENIIIDNTANKPMYFNIDKDKIVLNPKHSDFKQYNLQEALTHEIVHMIDTRNKLLKNNKNIYSNIRSAELEVRTNIDKYQEIFKEDNYFYDLSSGDTIGLLTGNKVKTFYYHPVGYANIEEDIVANIETAYLTDNKIALDLFEESYSLKKLKDKVVKMYDKYTR